MATLGMIILRFLWNEKGRVNPDSIRYMRTSKVFPIIDNTTTPLGYPLSLKFFTIFGVDEFWASKIVGVLAFLVIVFFAWQKKFYWREMLIIGSLFSFVSIFSYTMSEALIIPVVFFFLYISRQIIIRKYSFFNGFVWQFLLLVMLVNVRYSALFFILSTLAFGIIHLKKKYAKTFVCSALAALLFVVLYKIFFIDYFNEKYVSQFLETNLHSTGQLILEFFEGMTTTFNPLVHIANPGGGFVNVGIYGLGALTLVLMAFLFIKSGLSETEFFMVFTGIFGILCSFFIQYFYSVNALDYRLLAPFSLPLWMVFFKKLWQIFGLKTYLVGFLSLFTGLIFTFLSKGNYLENRKNVRLFLQNENLKNGKILFYLPPENGEDQVKIAELISTVNPNVEVTFKPKDTLKKNALTAHKVLTKFKISQNPYQ